jgi:hypothetical protein
MLPSFPNVAGSRLHMNMIPENFIQNKSAAADPESAAALGSI